MSHKQKRKLIRRTGNGKAYTKEEITVNMKDAGCNDAEIRDFLSLIKAGNGKQTSQILKKHSEKLLEKLHMTQLL